VKHPSPSTYPERYDGRSTAPRREPAYCPRSATQPTLRRRCDRTRSLAPKGSVVTGPYRDGLHGRGLPTALPANHCLDLARGRWVGLHRYERDSFRRDHSRKGQLLTRQGISLVLLLRPSRCTTCTRRIGRFRRSPYVAVGTGPSHHLCVETELVGVWSLRILSNSDGFPRFVV
jgi:hypothetical protein